jgi:hypothetical protein
MTTNRNGCYIVLSTSYAAGYDPFGRPTTVRLPTRNEGVKLTVVQSNRQVPSIQKFIRKASYSSGAWQCEVTEHGEVVSPGGMRIRVNR